MSMRDIPATRAPKTIQNGVAFAHVCMLPGLSVLDNGPGGKVL